MTVVKDNFPYASAGVYSDAYVVAKSDVNDLDPKPQALWIGGSGNLVLEMPSGDVTLTAVPAGVKIEVRPIKVKDATTATLIVALV